MPKPKRKRNAKIGSPSPSSPRNGAKNPGEVEAATLTLLTTPEERLSYELPVPGDVEAKLRHELLQTKSLDLQLRVYDLFLQELGVAKDKSARLYAQQEAAGELVNPEDYEDYVGRLDDCINRLRIERGRLQLQLDRKVPLQTTTVEVATVQPPLPLADSFAPARAPKDYPDVMTLAEVADLLRYKLPRFYQVYKELGIPFFMEGRQPRFEKADVLTWMRKRKNGK
ncbi:MAG TPA: hypothetical protein PKZ09_08415 [Bacillota bacterium]|nr:hypothetical protein [Bacillota bacterium]